jgi:aldehyde dehydrogenase (NAD+)
MTASSGQSAPVRHVVRSPIDGTVLGEVLLGGAEAAGAAAARAVEAFASWRTVPAPRRGEFVRQLGAALRAHKDAIARIVTLEAGKTVPEALGEVQEMIDVCDFACGLSRQIGGLTLPSERPGHHMREMWHPLGPVAVITAFNFPVAVWAWNAALALVCGNPVIWKPSEKTPLCAEAVQALVDEVAAGFEGAPAHLCQLVQGRADAGAALAGDPRIALVSATGSTAMGRQVAQVVAARFGRSLLELGGNAGLIVAPSADLDLAVRAVAFGAMGTAGQRCTSLRRLIVHADVADALIARLVAAYASLSIGDPRGPVLVGPLIDDGAGQLYRNAIARALAEGGRLLTPDDAPKGVPEGGTYVRPVILEMPGQTPVMHTETFAPVLYLVRYRDLDEAISLNNAVPQGLSSAILSTDLRETERFLSATGSDCGIANVNMGPSGAEIGGAFGGEKETGGGRESGSDSWKAYMRRQTQTVNWSGALPLAQGVRFDLA